MPDLPDYKTVLWAANGSPYWKTASGGKVYITPAVAMQYFDDPKLLSWARSKGFYIDNGRAGLNQQPTVDAQGVVHQPANPIHGSAPSGGLWRETGTWNGQTGEWDQPLDWGNIMSLAIGGGLTAGLGAAVAGGAGGSTLADAAAYNAATGTVATTPGSLAAATGVGISGVGGGAPILAPTAAAGGGGGWSTAANIAKVAAGGKSGGSMGAWDWVGPAINAGTQLYGANMQANAAQAQTEAGAAASKYSADLQAKAQQEALAFARQQAETDWQNQELARNANYGQWGARERRVSDFGTTVGLPGREIPAYVAGIDPRFTSGTLAGAAGGGTAASSGAPAGGLPQIDPSKPIGPQAAAYIQSRGATPNPTSAAYWQQKWPELVARGQEIGDPNYALKRLAAADELGGGGAPASSGLRFMPMSGTLASAITPYQQQPVTPALQLPGTISGLLR